MIAIIAVVVSLCVAVKLITVLTSPLRAIPNAHFSAPFSRLWLMWIRATEKEFSVSLAAHRRLGPIMRIGPNEISINGLEAVRTVYGGNWDKGGMYDIFTNYGHPPLFAMRNAKEHKERKRIFAPVYTKSAITKSPELREVLDAKGPNSLGPKLREWTSSGVSVNMFKVACAHSMDVVSSYICGLENGTNWLENEEEAAVYQKSFQSVFEPWNFFASSEIPRLVGMLSYLGIQLLPPSAISSLENIQSYVFGMTKRSVDALQARNSSSQVLQNLWQRMNESNIPKTETLNVFASDIMDQIHAGHEADAIVLTYLIWELSKDQKYQATLRAELKSLAESGSPPEDSKLLDNILIETMRLHPAAFGPFTRMAPEGAKINGFEIPAGTQVHASAYSLGRNLEVFPEPESWIPSRWDKPEDERKQMKKWVWMFSSGGRSCIGEHLAILTMKSFISLIYTSYKTEITAESNMHQLETVFALPADADLQIRFQAA